jgi:molybdopterin-guanine dinucleotide biosynthesis protein MobB
MPFPKNVSLKDALALILQSLGPLETIALPLDKALGHALAEDIYADHHIPPFDRAAMDGYVFTSQDTVLATKENPVMLRIKNEIHPSTADLSCVEKGQAARIMTGGSIPPNADTVVPQEEVQCDGDTVLIRTPAPPRQFVIKKGQDVKKGSLIAEMGTVVEPAHVGLLAALHVRKIAVTRKPVVAILSIGNELMNLHDTPSNPKIVASNRYMLSAMLEKQDFEVGISKNTKNDDQSIRKDLQEGLEKDMVITVGGTANADSDRTRAVIQATGVGIAFAGMAMRPGKGTTFGLHHKKPVFALPGTPSAVFTAFHSLVLPALRRLAGLPYASVKTIDALLEKDIKKKPGIEHVVQGIVFKKGALVRVLPLEGPTVARLPAMAKANGLIRMTPDKNRLVKGQSVSVQLLDPGESCFFSEYTVHRESKKQPLPIPPVISIVGKSDAGKTTFLERLLPELTARGHRVGTIKHDVHGFDIDHEGKDSWRHKQAGAHTVSISSPKKLAVIKDVDGEETIDSLTTKYFQDVDLILTEGYKKQNKPKIEIFRSTVHSEPLCRGDSDLVAILSDIPLDLGVPRFDLNDIGSIANFIETRFLGIKLNV